MATIKIDDIEYDAEKFSPDAKKQLQMLQLTDIEIQRLQAQLAIAQTARGVYFQALKKSLPTPLDQVLAQGETLKLS